MQLSTMMDIKQAIAVGRSTDLSASYLRGLQEAPSACAAVDIATALGTVHPNHAFFARSGEHGGLSVEHG